VTVDDLLNRPCSVSLFLLLSFLCFASLATPISARAQARNPPGVPPWADTTGESGVYPIGDAVGVYRAVLDLLFIDGDESPSIIVLHDTAEGRHGGGPCPLGCPERWTHKSKIDTATILAFARLSPKRPRIIPFEYRIPIAFMSWNEQQRMKEEGRAHLSAQNKANYLEGVEFLTEFRRKYPGAWGKLELTRVGFNAPHTEALVQASFFCGLICHSDEILFLKRIDNRWAVIERIPNEAEGNQPFETMRYRGPAGGSPTESEILVPRARDTYLGTHTESEDAEAVHRLVLDSLYSFHGESPRRIVLTDWFVSDMSALPSHRRTIEPSTLEKYAFLRSVRAPLYAKFGYSRQVSILPRDSIPAFETRGRPLEKKMEDSGEMSESTPFWLAFRQQYPDAWGMVGLTRVAFNQERTQALAFTNHYCGQSCHNADSWLLERLAETWRIVERIPREDENDWQLDSLRYLGVDADARAYRPRRIHGLVVSTETGRPLPGVTVMVTRGFGSVPTVTDRHGRYSVGSLPLRGSIEMRVPCPTPPTRKPFLVATLFLHPGLDSAMNVDVDFRRCLHSRPARALAGVAPAWPDALESTYPNPEVAAVYRGVLDALYPAGGARKGPILIHPITNRFSPLSELEFEEEMPRLIRLALADASMEKSIAKLPRDSIWFRPQFEYSRPVIILQPSAKRFLFEQGEDFREVDPKRDVSFTTLAKQAYPGADAILSFSPVAFNDAHNKALVQLIAGDSPEWGRREVMVLHKAGTAWRVARRHLELGKTSGERVAGRCEPVDAPTTAPTVDQLERLVGDADIWVSPTSQGLRAYAGSSHYRFISTSGLRGFRWQLQRDSLGRFQNQRVLAVVQYVDSSGKPGKRPTGLMTFDGHSAQVNFIADDGSEDGDRMERFNILEVRGREFFGSWLSGGGYMMPFKGYFCGRLR